MVQVKEGEIKELSRSKLTSYSSNSEYSEEIFKNNEESSNITSKLNPGEEITCFRYPAILLIGDTGAGKSTLGNWLLGYHGDDGPFETRATGDLVTLEPHTSIIQVNDRKYNLIDTPGLFDLSDNARSDLAFTKLANTINHCSYGIQAIILVLKKSFGREIDGRIQHIKGFLGEKSLDHMLIAFTHVNMDQTMDRSIMIKSFNSKMKSFLSRIENKWIVSPDPDLFSLDDDIVYTNVYEAKDIINSFPEAYTTDMFNRVRRVREEAEEIAKRDERLKSVEQELERIRSEINEAGRRQARQEVDTVGCFSLDAAVILEDGRKIEMSKVKIGDRVACATYNDDGISKLEYSEVYLIAHLDEHTRTELLKVEYTKPDGATGFLDLTSEHHLLINNSFDYARNIRPYDSQIQVLNNEELISARVTNVSKEIREGYIAIFTRTGTIIANDVLCSCYSNCPPYQNIIHYVLAPIRFATLFRKSNYCDNGIHPHLKFLYNNYQFISGIFTSNKLKLQ